MNWFYMDGDKIYGPVNDDAVKVLVKAGVIKTATLVRREDVREWVQAGRDGLIEMYPEQPFTAPQSNPMASLDTILPLAPVAVELIQDGEEIGQIEIGESPMIFGQNDDCDVCIPDASVSGQHARMALIDGLIFVEPISCDNEVKVNGQPIVRLQPLFSGDTLQLGTWLVEFRIRKPCEKAACVEPAKPRVTRKKRRLAVWLVVIFVAVMTVATYLALTREPQKTPGLMYRLAEQAYKAGNDKEAAIWCRRAAKKGNADAQALLGIMFTQGRGVTKSQKEAGKWLRLAAAADNSRAQFNLGLAYEYGEGVSQDFAEAARWYKKAAKNGLAAASYNLGVLYADGKGVQQDYKEAFYYFEEASTMPEGAFNVGVSYYHGRGVKRDLEQAAKYFRAAADEGYEPAQRNLAYMIEHGEATPNDPALSRGPESPANGEHQGVAGASVTKYLEENTEVTMNLRVLRQILRQDPHVFRLGTWYFDYQRSCGAGHKSDQKTENADVLYLNNLNMAGTLMVANSEVGLSNVPCEYIWEVESDGQLHLLMTEDRLSPSSTGSTKVWVVKVLAEFADSKGFQRTPAILCLPKRD